MSKTKPLGSIAGDSCTSVENAYFITHSQFRQWNPSVSEDCSTGFWLGKQPPSIHLPSLESAEGRRRHPDRPTRLRLLRQHNRYHNHPQQHLHSDLHTTEPSGGAHTQPGRQRHLQLQQVRSCTDRRRLLGECLALSLSFCRCLTSDANGLHPSDRASPPAMGSLQRIFMLGMPSLAAMAQGATANSGRGIIIAWASLSVPHRLAGFKFPAKSKVCKCIEVRYLGFSSPTEVESQGETRLSVLIPLVES